MKYDLIAEAYLSLLIEGRIDDLKAQNPHLVNEIDSYANQDPTPQKKFVPWLVSQHKKGNVTPDEPDLNQTLSGFETYKSRHGIRDHSSKTYQEIRDAVQPFLGTAATNKEQKQKQIHEGIEQIYSSPDNKIQAFHVKTKEASQHVYGGGKHLGGLHTDWCVAARSEQCLFGKYGKMYTIHVKDDTKSPYAVHLGGYGDDRITTRDNAPDEYKLNEGLQKFPHLKDAVDKIKEIKKAADAELIKKIKNNDPRINVNDINEAAKNPNPEVAMAALNHPKANATTTFDAASHPNPEVAMAALNHPEANVETTYLAALNNPNPEVVMAALKHPEADYYTVYVAANNPNPEVAIAALNHPKARNYATHSAAYHLNPEVAIAALNHRTADRQTIDNALKHPDQRVRELAKQLQGTK